MWYLRITPDEFKELYPDGDISLFEKDYETDEDLIANYLPNKLWRLNNLYTIVNKDGIKVSFNMNRAQHRAYSSMLRHSRLIILKSRQQGISTFWLMDYFDDALFIDDLNIGMLAQGLEEASTLLERVKTAWDNFPGPVKEFLGIAVVKDNSKEYSFNNGSTIFIRTSFRSATLQRLHVSEMGKISAKDPLKAKELMTGTMQAIKGGNPVVIESTAEGRKNQFYKMWYDADDFIGTRGLKDFKPLFLSWVDDPDCIASIPQRETPEDAAYFGKVENDLGIVLSNEQKWWCIGQRRELKENYDQEYPYNAESAFAAVRDGAYYATIWKGCARRVEGLYDPALPVRVAMDLGVNDDMVLVFWQEWVAGDGRVEIRVIRMYKNSGEGLEHYYNYMVKTGYAIDRVVLPHDVKVRELGTGKTRLGMLKSMGMRRIKVLPRTNSVPNDIEFVRRAIPYMILESDPSSGCGYMEDMFHNYSKSWDERLGTWKDKPLHDEWSNPADAVRYMVMADFTKVGDREMRRLNRKRVRRVSRGGGMAL